MTESPDIDNTVRAARFELTLLHYNGDSDDVANLVDLLADARHWCDVSGQCYGDLDRVAQAHYLAELEAEGRQL